MKSTSLSVVLNTKNSEQFLEAALKSVAFADEIIVVDMQSTDATKSIAKKYTSHVFNHKDVGYVEPARNFAIGKTSSKTLQPMHTTFQGLMKSLDIRCRKQAGGQITS